MPLFEGLVASTGDELERYFENDAAEEIEPVEALINPMTLAAYIGKLISGEQDPLPLRDGRALPFFLTLLSYLGESLLTPEGYALQVAALIDDCRSGNVNCMTGRELPTDLRSLMPKECDALASQAAFMAVRAHGQDTNTLMHNEMYAVLFPETEQPSLQASSTFECAA